MMCGWTVLFLILSLAWADKGNGRDELPAHKRQSVQYSTLVGPSFVDTQLYAHAHAPIGQTAYLTCVVKNLHNYTVSWVRARDIHLLTAGETTYTSDNRFVAVNPGGGDQWMLRIHHAQPSDAGTYLCQVSVSPPMSTSVTLLVTQAVANIRPGAEVYLKAGSRVVLVCEVFGCPYPALPAWYRGQQLQDGTETEEGRVQVTSPPTTKQPSSTPAPSDNFSGAVADDLLPQSHPRFKPSKHSHGGRYHLTETSTESSPPNTMDTTSTIIPPVGLPFAKSTFIRAKASAVHSGVYTCTNTCTNSVNLTLHVLTGDEETAAMQHPNGSLGLFALSEVVCFLTILASNARAVLF
ncbi:uncharacterized protein LOC135215126 [Macrobrachium nipponense]|uniref:uncharacterized protein LOC135215126 n=1 Tax=Macrobrachium nipponense TaxID=159736 RepID=UPI0030C89B95